MAVSEELRSQDPELFGEINKYIDEIKKEAQGDYDFVVKFLKKQFERALGTNDQERAGFFAKVANQLEARVGRIPFDYDLKTGREKEDLANFLKSQDLKDSKLREEEMQFTKQQELASAQEQKKIRQEASARGMLDSGIQQRQQAEATQARQTNIIEPQTQEFAYRKALSQQQRGEALLQSERNLQDITTGARRAGEDEQTSYQYGQEKAQKTLAERLAEAERARMQQYRSGLALVTQQRAIQAEEA